MGCAVVLLSGGLDSAVAAAWARAEGSAIVALTVDYGQRHAVETDAARRVAAAVGAAEHLIVRADLRAIGGSVLTAPGDVPKDRTLSEDSIPPTYVPARNTVLLALALGAAESRGARAIVIGANAVDYSGYPDCRPAFLAAFSELAAVATKAGLEGRAPQILAPLLDLSKAEIVRLGARLGAPLHLTHSCYDPAPGGVHCGRCDACALRRKGFLEAGVADPTPYRS